jgi:uncharacterized protein (TIGR00369 family)
MAAEPVPRLKLSAREVAALIDEHFPQLHEGTGPVAIEAITPLETVVRMRQDARTMRPGGTVSGPAMFKLADFSVYAAILGALGADALQAVTTNMTISFLIRPRPADLLARTRLIKLGRRLAVAEVELYSEGIEQMVAHATSTYALPPRTDR